MHKNLYKQSLNKCERQESRRKELLQQQKLKRLEQQDVNRHHEDGHDDRKQKFYMSYKNPILDSIQLQFSEWFKENPDNLHDWLLVPCPKGQRCLIVAEKGRTKMFNKHKRYCMTFSSLLPGGGLNGSDNDCCILDCIFNQEMDTFYVLDALHFAIPLVDCDAEFRFFWLKSKFNEIRDLEDRLDDVKNFILLDNYDISNEEHLTMILENYPLWPNNQPQLDGFLFYHKQSHYVFGTTPLVCWLFPFMLPDVLQITVSKSYEVPANYCNQNPWQYMNEFDKELTRRRNKKRNKNRPILNVSTMEEDIEDENVLESLLTAEKMLELEDIY